MKIALVQLGCDKNRVDGEIILGQLVSLKYEIVNKLSEADVIVINTCGFINDAKKESINVILSCLEYHKKLVVTGCLVERYLDELKKSIPEVDLWIPIHDYYRFNELFSSLDKNIKDKQGLCETNRIISTGNFSAYLRIGEGCSNHCSYCAIPIIRGEYRSRNFYEIINEAISLVNRGYKELIILEQDTTKYGIDIKGESLVSLLKELVKIKGLYSIRLLYLYPDEITDELIEFIKQNPIISPYFDIPIQHSESHILKRMNRRGDKDFLLNLFTKIKAQIPNAILRTTIMVGFPGETKKDIDNLCSFMKEICFDHLGAFKYSSEDGTPSSKFKDQISEKDKQIRLDKIMRLQQKISYKNNQKHLGEIMEGIVIGKENNYYLLRSYFNAPDDIDGKIKFTSTIKLNVGDIVKIKITNSYTYDLIGELL